MGEVIGQDAGLSQFFCETCDKDLKSEEMRKQHFSEHIPCAYPGCKFEAHFLVIEKHIRMAHGNGIGAISLETEEDIRKWREERRKNYPTRAKVNEKKEAQMVKQKRGEQIKTKKFDVKEKRKEKRQKEPKKKKEQKVVVKPKRAKLSTGQIVAYSESSSSSSSSEEEEEEVSKDVKIMNARLAKVNDNMKAQPDYETLYNGKLLRSHWTNIQKNGKRVRYPVGSYKNNYSFDARTIQPDREMPTLARPTLLEMLLKNEIRQERNQLLQALFFIVEKD